MAARIYRVSFISHKGTLQVVNTLHVVDESLDYLDDNAQDVADAVNTDLQATYRSMLPTTYTLDSIDAVQVPFVYGSSEGLSGGSHALGIAGARTVADEDLPPRLCSAIQWRTGVVSRTGKGRMFVPPMETKVGLTSDLITSGSDYGLAITAFAADVVDQGMPNSLYYCVYSRKLHAAGDSSPYRKITGSVWSRKVAYLSSRDR